MSTPIDVDSSTARSRSRPGIAWRIPALILVLATLGFLWGWTRLRASGAALERTENALQLQVLGSRLGVAAFEAAYGDFPTARAVASEAFDGIANYGIEQGVLPRDYADALAQRDAVIAGLATRDAAVSERLMGLFFGLQIPVDTELDPTHIVPAADSGLGLEPPRRDTTHQSPARIERPDSVPLSLPTRSRMPATDDTLRDSGDR